MATDSSNALVPFTGAVSRGDDTATAPTDVDAPLGTGWTDLGYISDAGITEARARETNEIKAFQNGDTIYTAVTGSTLTYRIVALETKAEVLEAYYGVSVAADGSVTVNGAETGGRTPWNFDYEAGNDISVRAYAPLGEVTEVGDQVIVNGEPVGYEMTVTCYPDANMPTVEGRPGAVKKWYSSLDTTGV